jgi:hypothetical protein
MNHETICYHITRKFTVGDHPPKIKHHCAGVAANTYSYRPWDTNLCAYAVNWIWLGKRPEMFALLGFKVTEHPIRNRYRWHYPGLPARYFEMYPTAISYAAQNGGGVIFDRQEQKVVWPSTGQEVI